MGTKEGAKKAIANTKAKYGSDFFVVNGRMGGKKGHTGGFYGKPELARMAGMKSRRRALESVA